MFLLNELKQFGEQHKTRVLTQNGISIALTPFLAGAELQCKILFDNRII